MLCPRVLCIWSGDFVLESYDERGKGDTRASGECTLSAHPLSVTSRVPFVTRGMCQNIPGMSVLTLGLPRMCSNLDSMIAQNRMLVSRVVPSVSESPDPAVSQVETNKPGYQNSSSLRQIQHIHSSQRNLSERERQEM